MEGVQTWQHYPHLRMVVLANRALHLSRPALQLCQSLRVYWAFFCFFHHWPHVIFSNHSNPPRVRCRLQHRRVDQDADGPVKLARVKGWKRCGRKHVNNREMNLERLKEGRRWRALVLLECLRVAMGAVRWQRGAGDVLLTIVAPKQNRVFPKLLVLEIHYMCA